MRFKNRTVVLTGGTAGLGEVTVKAFAREGAHVFFCGLIDAEGERVAAEATEAATQAATDAAGDAGAGGTARYRRADVRRAEDMAALVGDAVAATGRLDVAVNNAAISHAAARMAEQPLDSVNDVFATNIMGVWHAMHHQIPPMARAGRGAIVNVASILGAEGAPWMAAYGASKHAVIGLTKSAALDYAGAGLRINALSPGPMRTPMFRRALEDIGGDLSKYAGGLPDSGPLDPAAVAETVLFLASDGAAGINGANIIVDAATTSGHAGPPETRQA